MPGAGVRPDVAPPRVGSWTHVAVAVSLVCVLGGVGPVSAQSGGCAPPSHAVVVDDGDPVVLSTTTGCGDGRYTYDASWDATYEPLRLGDADVRDAAPAADGGWWLLGEAALHRVDGRWRPTGETVSLPAANGTRAGPNETTAFRSVASAGGRLWLSGDGGVVALDPATGDARATDLRAATGLYGGDDRLWTLRATSRGGTVTRHEVGAGGTATPERSVRVGPEVRQPADLVRTERGWLVVSDARNLFVYAPDWTYTGERHGSTGLLGALAILAPAGALTLFGAVLVLRLRPSLLRRFGAVAAASTVLALAVRQSLLPAPARGLYALPGVVVAALLLVPWALAAVTLRDEGPRAVLAGLLLLGAAVALPVAAEFVIAA